MKDINIIGQRLRLEMKKRGMSSVELGKRADVKTSFLYDVMSGKSANPSSVLMARVAAALDVSLAYLTGSDASSSGYEFSVPSLSEGFVAILPAEKDAKLGNANFHFHKDWIKKTIGTTPNDLRSYTVQSDNMQPTLQVGDSLLIDTTKKHPSPPGMFLLFDGVALVVKRVEFMAQQNKLRISCDNAHYSSYDSPAEETAIIGRVVWLSRAF